MTNYLYTFQRKYVTYYMQFLYMTDCENQRKLLFDKIIMKTRGQPDIQTALTLIDRKNLPINLTSRQREVIYKMRFASVVKILSHLSGGPFT